MKVLQIWFDKKMPEEVKGYMKSVRDNTPDASYYFIGEQQNAPPGAICLNPQAEIEKAFAKLGNRSWWEKYCSANMFKADMIRLAWAIDMTDLLYVDADVEFVSPPMFSTSSLPIMGVHKGFQEFFLFYVNDCRRWFEDLVAFTLKRPPIPGIFMGVFGDIKLGRCLNSPAKFKENTFYVRH